MDNEVKAALLQQLEAAQTPNQVLLAEQKLAAARASEE